MVANEKFVRMFRLTIQAPYPISTLSLAIASGVLARVDYVRQTINAVRNERGRAHARLAKMDGVKVFSSDANFLFIETGSNYQPISKALRSSRIVVKELDNVAGHKGCMRVTIGTREMNDKFLQCVEGSL